MLHASLCFIWIVDGVTTSTSPGTSGTSTRIGSCCCSCRGSCGSCMAWGPKISSESEAKHFRQNQCFRDLRCRINTEVPAESTSVSAHFGGRCVLLYFMFSKPLSPCVRPARAFEEQVEHVEHVQDQAGYSAQSPETAFINIRRQVKVQGEVCWHRFDQKKHHPSPIFQASAETSSARGQSEVDRWCGSGYCFACLTFQHIHSNGENNHRQSDIIAC